MRGYDFHRQKPLDRYIVDFFCYELMLVIEVDGISHDGKRKEDAYRQKRLEAYGLHFLRYADHMVKEYLPDVLEDIFLWIEKNQNSIQPYDGRRPFDDLSI